MTSSLYIENVKSFFIDNRARELNVIPATGWIVLINILNLNMRKIGLFFLFFLLSVSIAESQELQGVEIVPISGVVTLEGGNDFVIADIQLNKSLPDVDTICIVYFNTVVKPDRWLNFYSRKQLLVNKDSPNLGLFFVILDENDSIVSMKDYVGTPQYVSIEDAVDEMNTVIYYDSCTQKLKSVVVSEDEKMRYRNSAFSLFMKSARIRLCLVMSDYDLKPGKYKIQLLYCNKHGRGGRASLGILCPKAVVGYLIPHTIDLIVE